VRAQAVTTTVGTLSRFTAQLHRAKTLLLPITHMHAAYAREGVWCAHTVGALKRYNNRKQEIDGLHTVSQVSPLLLPRSLPRDLGGVGGFLPLIKKSLEKFSSLT